MGKKDLLNRDLEISFNLVMTRNVRTEPRPRDRHQTRSLFIQWFHEGGNLFERKYGASKMKLNHRSRPETFTPFTRAESKKFWRLRRLKIHSPIKQACQYRSGSGDVQKEPRCD